MKSNIDKTKSLMEAANSVTSMLGGDRFAAGTKMGGYKPYTPPGQSPPDRPAGPMSERVRGKGGWWIPIQGPDGQWDWGWHSD